MIEYKFVDDSKNDGKPSYDHEWLTTQEFEALYVNCNANRNPLSALRLGRGTTLLMTEISIVPDHTNYNGVSIKQRVIHKVDATEMLMKFARWCALSVLHKWNAPKCVKEYLETGDASKRLDCSSFAIFTSLDNESIESIKYSSSCAGSASGLGCPRSIAESCVNDAIKSYPKEEHSEAEEEIAAKFDEMVNEALLS